MINKIHTQDPEVAKTLKAELKRQQNSIELIPSENFVSLAVLQALGSVLTNKYAEGYPGQRYYGGTNNVDIIENLAIERAKKLFSAEHANVQPLSGAPANIATYFALLKPGETILGMDLSHGGHLTHGHPVTGMSKIFNFVRYKTDPQTGLINYEELEKLTQKHQPKLILVGYSAYSREIDYKRIKNIADKIKAYTMADIAHLAGLIAAGEMNNPVPIFDVVTTTTHKTLRGPRGGMILCKKNLAKKIDKAVFPGLQGGPHQHNIAAKAVAFGEALQPEFKGYAKQIKKNAKTLENKLKDSKFKIQFQTTDNHLLLLDVSGYGLSGAQAEKFLDQVNITCNKNMIPDDPRSPLDPSGLRIGTPAMTTRGFKEKEFTTVADLITRICQNPENKSVQSEIKQEVRKLTEKYPLYPELNYSLN